MLTPMGTDPNEARLPRRQRRRLWDAYARVYDLGISRLAPYRQMQRDVLLAARIEIERLSSDSQEKPLHVLDLCCGTGNMLRRSLALFPNSRATGIDLSAAMLRHARRKCRRKGDVRWICGDALSELGGFADETFDLVYVCNAFYPQLDKEGLASEIQRTLRPAGALILTDPRRGANLMTLLANHLESDGAVGIHILPFLMVSTLFSLVVQGNSTRTFWDADRVRELLTRSGLAVDRMLETYGGANYLLVARKVIDPEPHTLPDSVRYLEW